jgi:hypothetical protein
VTFTTPSDRDAFITAVDSAQDKSTRGPSFRVITPKQLVHGVKRPADSGPEGAVVGSPGGGSGGSGGQHKGKKAKKGGPVRREDVRDAVCPSWNVPYGQQLNGKLEKVEQYLQEITKRVSGGQTGLSCGQQALILLMRGTVARDEAQGWQLNMVVRVSLGHACCNGCLEQDY